MGYERHNMRVWSDRCSACGSCEGQHGCSWETDRPLADTRCTDVIRESSCVETVHLLSLGVKV